MWRRDYFMRMVEQLTQVLARVLKLSDSQEFEEATILIDQATRELIGLNMIGVMGVSDEDLINLLQRNTSTITWAEKGAVLTALLDLNGDLRLQQGQEELAVACYLKALHLRLATISEEVEPVDDVPTVTFLLGKLADYILPTPTYLALLGYYEETGEYAEAEDVLYDWLDVKPNDPEVVEAGILLYERLLLQSDMALQAGNLPREEVEAGLTELQQVFYE